MNEKKEVIFRAENLQTWFPITKGLVREGRRYMLSDTLKAVRPSLRSDNIYRRPSLVARNVTVGQGG